MKITAFAASSSINSINKKLITYALTLIHDATPLLLDLNDYELPLFSEDKEKAIGAPMLANEFLSHIGAADALIISFAEHNGCYSAAYKNLFDWCSRINNKVYQNKPILLLATSPGGRGGASVLSLATTQMPFFGGEVKASLSIPNFYDNFDLNTGTLSNVELNEQLIAAINELRASM